MLDPQVWDVLSITEKAEELGSLLNQLLDIDAGRHPMYNSREEGKLVQIKKDLKQRIAEITQFENGDL